MSTFNLACACYLLIFIGCQPCLKSTRQEAAIAINEIDGSVSLNGSVHSPKQIDFKMQLICEKVVVMIPSVSSFHWQIKLTPVLPRKEMKEGLEAWFSFTPFFLNEAIIMITNNNNQYPAK